MFGVPMGVYVVRRRQLIEDHVLEVNNLDVYRQGRRLNWGVTRKHEGRSPPRKLMGMMSAVLVRDFVPDLLTSPRA